MNRIAIEVPDKWCIKDGKKCPALRYSFNNDTVGLCPIEGFDLKWERRKNTADELIGNIPRPDDCKEKEREFIEMARVKYQEGYTQGYNNAMEDKA